MTSKVGQGPCLRLEHTEMLIGHHGYLLHPTFFADEDGTHSWRQYFEGPETEPIKGLRLTPALWRLCPETKPIKEPQTIPAMVQHPSPKHCPKIY